MRPPPAVAGTFFHIAGEVPSDLVELCGARSGCCRRTTSVGCACWRPSHLTHVRPGPTPAVALLSEAEEQARHIGDPELIGTVLVA